MLRAQQYQVINQANIAMIGLRNQEIQYFNQFFTSFGTQSAVIGGFMVAALAQTPGLDPLHQKNGMIYSYIYWICTMLAISTGLYCIVGSLYVTVFGSGLALRGPVGSMVKAVNGMVQEQHIMILTFSFTLLFANISLMGIYFIQMEIHLAIICSIINLLGLYLWYDSCIRIYNRFQFIGDSKRDKTGSGIDGNSDTKHRVFPGGGGNQDNQKWFDDDDDDHHAHHGNNNKGGDYNRQNSLTEPLLSVPALATTSNSKPSQNPIFSRLFTSSPITATGGRRLNNPAISITNRVAEHNNLVSQGHHRQNSDGGIGIASGVNAVSGGGVPIACKGYLTVKETRKRFLPSFLSSASSTNNNNNNNSISDVNAKWSRKYVVITPDVITHTYTTSNYYADEDHYLKQPLKPENKRPIIFDQDYVFQEIINDDELIGFKLFVPTTTDGDDDNKSDDSSNNDGDNDSEKGTKTATGSTSDFSFFNRSSHSNTAVGKSLKTSTVSSASDVTTAATIKKTWQFRCDTIQELFMWKQAFLHLQQQGAMNNKSSSNNSNNNSATSSTRSWPVTINETAVAGTAATTGTAAYVRNRNSTITSVSGTSVTQSDGWKSHV